MGSGDLNAMLKKMLEDQKRLADQANASMQNIRADADDHPVLTGDPEIDAEYAQADPVVPTFTLEDNWVAPTLDDMPTGEVVDQAALDAELRAAMQELGNLNEALRQQAAELNAPDTSAPYLAEAEGDDEGVVEDETPAEVAAPTSETAEEDVVHRVATRKRAKKPKATAPEAPVAAAATPATAPTGNLVICPNCGGKAVQGQACTYCGNALA